MNQNLVKEWNKAAKELNTIPLIKERMRYAATIKPLLQLPKNYYILEAGCGAGRILRTLDVLGYKNLVGLEISQARLDEISRLEQSCAKLVCSDNIPFESEIFNAVISAAVIEHVLEPSSWLSELARVTKKDGLVSIATDTYMWKWLKILGLYRSIQPLDEAICPSTLIKWGKQAGLELMGCGGFINTEEQKAFFGKQLLGLIPKTGRLRNWLNRSVDSVISKNETEAIIEAIETFPFTSKIDIWSCIWSYECYYWFRKK